ncbi:hypothetical protein ACHAXR_011145 [Thalassiosira sp. AJA248-18]
MKVSRDRMKMPHIHFSHVTILDDHFTLAKDIEMEIKYSLPANRQDKHLPALIFLHGSFHSAWCWAEKFMPYFSSIGYPCVALSLRGTSKTYSDHNEEENKKVKIVQHVDDVLCFLKYLYSRMHNDDKYDGTMRLFFEFISGSVAVAPIIIGHSFGGLICMKLLERLEKDNQQSPEQPQLMSSIALLCSVPPSGITKMSLRAMRRNPLKGWRIMKGLAMKKAVSDPKLCRMLFFDEELPDESLMKYMTYFQKDSKVTMDMHDLASKLPNTDGDGCSTSIGVLQYQALVIGGTKDYIVDHDAIKETARFLSAATTIMVNGAVHEVMLAACWVEVAKELELWLSSIVKMSSAPFSRNCIKYK